MQQEEAVIHVNIADGGTGLIVGGQIRQFIVITESFARMTRTDTAGNIYLLADDILPYLVDSLDVGAVTRNGCLLYTSPSPRDLSTSRMPSSA